MALEDLPKRDYRWWDAKEPHKVVFDCLNQIRKRDGDRKELTLDNMRLYGNRDLLGASVTSYTQTKSKDRLTLNIIKSAIDTVSAKIAKSRPKPTFLTHGGNYSLKRKARLLERWVDAQFYTTKTYKTGVQVFIDACVFGTGVLKVFREGKEIKTERVFAGELFVDQSEALYGEPRQIFQKKWVNRDVLLSLFPKYARDIKRASCSDEENHDFGRDTLADQVLVCEAWRLPSSKDAGDGKHIIAIDTCVLLEEKWDLPVFPFVFLNWSNPLRGFWGTGLAEELTGIQIEINRLLKKIQKAFHLMAVPHFLVDQGSKIQKMHLNNEIGGIIPYVGQPPTVITPQTVHPEVFAHLNNLIQRAFEIAGVNQLSAASQIPAGIESGKAMLVYNDFQTERFALVAQRYEELFMQTAYLMVHFGKQISKEHPGYTVVASRDKYTIEQVEWSEVDMDPDSYVMKVFPTSSLPSHPVGRLNAIESLINAGIIEDKGEAKRLLDYPDLESSMALDRAANDNIERIIEKILDTGVYEAPEPYQDHQLALKKFQASYQKAVNDGVPDLRLMRMRQFMLATHHMMRKAEMEAVAQQAGVPLQPGAPPAAGPNGAPPTAVMPGAMAAQ